jgi:hypothetical protein
VDQGREAWGAFALQAGKTGLFWARFWLQGTNLKARVWLCRAAARAEERALFGEEGVKMGKICLTHSVKVGYNVSVFGSFVYFVLRILLIATVWAFVWRLVEPRTQVMRILRATLLVLSLLFVLGVLRMVEGG